MKWNSEALFICETPTCQRAFRQPMPSFLLFFSARVALLKCCFSSTGEHKLRSQRTHYTQLPGERTPLFFANHGLLCAHWTRSDFYCNYFAPEYCFEWVIPFLLFDPITCPSVLRNLAVVWQLFIAHCSLRPGFIGQRFPIVCVIYNLILLKNNPFFWDNSQGAVVVEGWHINHTFWNI